MAKLNFTKSVISLLVLTLSIGLLSFYWSFSLFTNDWKFFGFLCAIVSIFSISIFAYVIYEETIKKNPETSFENINIDDFLKEYSNVISKELKIKILVEKEKGEKLYKINSFIFNNIKSKQLDYIIKANSSSRKVNNINIDSRNKYSIINEAYKPKSKQEVIARVKYLEVEQKELQSTLNRHTQIIQESLNIIYNSKNIETIKSRYETIVEHYNYSIEYKRAGYEINIPLNFLSDLNTEYNKRLAEISKMKTNEYNLKYNSLKTEKAKDNHTKKIYNELENIETSLVYSTNSSKVKNDLNDLRDKIEDIYS